MKKLRVPIIVIYQNPIDYPKGTYVARLFDIDKPTALCKVSKSLEEARSIVPSYMAKIDRKEEDEKQILETWI